MTHTYLLIADLPSNPAPYWTYLKSPQKNFRPPLYNFLCLKLRGHWTESHQISTRCTDMIDNYSAKIKIAIFQFIWKRQRDEWRSKSNCVRIAAKIARLNSVDSEITGHKVTKLGNDVASLLSLNCWKRIVGINCRFWTTSTSGTPPFPVSYTHLTLPTILRV